MRSVAIQSPAKVNLGLAILGKRDDGYHEIDTILAMIDLCDGILISESIDAGISISGMDNVAQESNLMTKAARLWSEAAGIEPRWRIEIQKRIPSPGGLGGGSSNAASVLLALNHLYASPIAPEDLHHLATMIGSDCPFFLGGPCARATGTGTDLRPLPRATGWVVMAVPRISDAAKTTTLYGALTLVDYGNSVWIDDLERNLTANQMPGGALPNSFTRAAFAQFPLLDDLHQTMHALSGAVSLSGAGPAMFTTTTSQTEAQDWATGLRSKVSGDTEVSVAEFLQSIPTPEIRT